MARRSFTFTLGRVTLHLHRIGLNGGEVQPRDDTSEAVRQLPPPRLPNRPRRNQDDDQSRHAQGQGVRPWTDFVSWGDGTTRPSRPRAPGRSPWHTPTRCQEATRSPNRSPSWRQRQRDGRQPLRHGDAGPYRNDAHRIAGLGRLRAVGDLHRHRDRPRDPDGPGGLLCRSSQPGRSDRHRHPDGGQRPGSGHLEYLDMAASSTPYAITAVYCGDATHREAPRTSSTESITPDPTTTTGSSSLTTSSSASPSR